MARPVVIRASSTRSIWLALGLTLVSAEGWGADPIFINDVTKSAQELGNPANNFYPGQGLGSVQDLQLFGGRIYVGYGNLDNRVAKNPIYLDPASVTFLAENPVAPFEEEIFRRFRVFGGEMYVESFDPIGLLSNLYVRDTNEWRVAPMDFPGSGRHNFDIFNYDGLLFTGGGTGFPGIAISADGGSHWTLPGATLTNAAFYDPEFFVFNGQLFVSQDLTYSAFFPELAAPFLLKYTGAANAPFAVVQDKPATFYPAGDMNAGRICHFELYRKTGVFIAEGAIYLAHSVEPAVLNKVVLPNDVSGHVVDLLARSNGVYFLASIPQNGSPTSPYLGVIGRTEDLRTWTELCRFHTREVVQSFELADGNFFVGLGNYLTTAGAHSGDVLGISKLAANEIRSAVVPAVLESTNGTAEALTPFGLGASVRYQQVVLGSALAPVSGPFLITKLAFRPGPASHQAFTCSVASVRIDLSTTTASPPGLSTQFSANLGPDAATVFAGPLTWSSGSVETSDGTEPFDFEVSFQKPFIYDPGRGNLLVDVRNFLGGTCPPLEAAGLAGLPIASVFSVPGGVNDSTGMAASVSSGLITKFTFRSVASTNAAPLVSAGLDQTITLPSLAVLEGAEVDDFRPDPPGTVTSLWTQASGPGPVVFGDAVSLKTTAQFPQHGTFVLRLLAGDGARTGSAEVVISVRPIPRINLPPVVRAGPDQTLTRTNQMTGATNVIQLRGVVADDGFPQPPGVTTSVWFTVSGPSMALFDDPGSVAPRARFVQPGKYVLRLVAGDGEFSAGSDVNITVTDGATTNQPPTVNAGLDQMGSTLAPIVLHGLVTDDGLPAGTGALTLAWSKVSGPASVQFAPATNLTTAVLFGQPGKYVLRLTASDGRAQSGDDTLVEVLDARSVVIPNNLTTTSGRGGNGFPFNLSEPVRYQQVYPATQFPSNAGPFLVSQMAFRPSATSGGSFSAQVQELVIELSTTRSGGAGLSVNFGDNVGADRQVAFRGGTTLSSAFTGTGAKTFDVVVPFQRPFLYEPRDGNLLVDIRNPYGSLTTYLDSSWGSGFTGSRVASRPGGVNDAQGVVDPTPTGLVTRFILLIPPAPDCRVDLEWGRPAVHCEGVFGQRLNVQSSSNLIDWVTVGTYLPLFWPIPIPIEADTQDVAHQFYRAYVSP